jgi:hypothetical protein
VSVKILILVLTMGSLPPVRTATGESRLSTSPVGSLIGWHGAAHGPFVSSVGALMEILLTNLAVGLAPRSRIWYSTGVGDGPEGASVPGRYREPAIG